MESNYKKKRKYDSKYRKKISEKFNKINDKEILLKLYKIIRKDLKNKISKNNNGVFFDMNKLTDNCIQEISDILNDNIDITTSEIKLSYIPYSSQKYNSEEGLSNKDKNILKKCKKTIDI
jgi:hypothetical protein